MRQSGGTESDEIVKAGVHSEERRGRRRGCRAELIQDLDGAFLEQLVERPIWQSPADERRELRTPRFDPGPERAPSFVHHVGQGRHGVGAELAESLPRLRIIMQQLPDPITGRSALVARAAIEPDQNPGRENHQRDSSSDNENSSQFDRSYRAFSRPARGEIARQREGQCSSAPEGIFFRASAAAFRTLG